MSEFADLVQEKLSRLRTVGEACHKCRNCENVFRGEKEWVHGSFGRRERCSATEIRDLQYAMPVRGPIDAWRAEVNARLKRSGLGGEDIICFPDKRWRDAELSKIRALGLSELLEGTISDSGGDDYEGQFTPEAQFRYDAELSELRARLWMAGLIEAIE